MFSCELFNILFSYEDEDIGGFSNLHQCTFKKAKIFFCSVKHFGILAGVIIVYRKTHGLEVYYFHFLFNYTQNQSECTNMRGEEKEIMRSSRRDHYIDVSDNIYRYISALSCRCFFKIMNFSDRFRQCFKLFYSFEKQLFMDFLEFPKKYSRKTA